MAEARKTPFIVKAWYQGALWLWLLLPLSWLFRIVIAVRDWLYQKHLFSSYRAAVPVIVVGNISVGGTGKTPLVIALITRLRQAGFKPGVISRGYGSQANDYPYVVTSEDNAETSGDEPLLIAQRTEAPVVIDANRGRAAEKLLEEHSCDVIITDDGLQHYALQRDIECVVVDAQRGFGNGQCLPVGPLREPLSRLQTVDFIIANGGKRALAATNASEHVMQLQAGQLVHLTTKKSQAVVEWSGTKRIHAIAGIGNPARFFDGLRELGFDVVEHAFADHHAYEVDDLSFGDELPIIMTEKDAVKIRPFASDRCWYLPVDARIDDRFYTALIKRLKAVSQ